MQRIKVQVIDEATQELVDVEEFRVRKEQHWREALSDKYSGDLRAKTLGILEVMRILQSRLTEMVEVYNALGDELNQPTYESLRSAKEYIQGHAVSDAMAILAEAELLDIEELLADLMKRTMDFGTRGSRLPTPRTNIWEELRGR